MVDANRPRRREHVQPNAADLTALLAARGRNQAVVTALVDLLLAEEAWLQAQRPAERVEPPRGRPGVAPIAV